MPENSLHELYVDELKDIYSAETQLVKALPKMAKAATSQQLSSGFQKHLVETKGHVARLEKIFQNLKESPKGKKCKGMEGLVEEGSKAIEDYGGAVKDAALIGAAQRVEHYEIAAYGTVIAFAETMGHSDHVKLLEQTLNEEKATDEKLTELSESINTEANGSETEELPQAEQKRKARSA